MSLTSSVKKHERVIYTAAITAAAAGVPGAFVPALDIGAISGAWGTMLIMIADKSGRELDYNTAMKLATAILGGAAAYLGGSKVFTMALNLIPGFGTVTAVGINSLLNFLYTVRLGSFIARQMEKTDFDTNDIAHLVPELTAIVFAVPTFGELRGTWNDYRENQSYS
jgi:uncharacterized protein (DUF697 family)